MRMVELTNQKLVIFKKPQLTTGELLKFLGILILGTRYEFGHRADLWRTEAGSRILQAPAFGTKTGMPRKRFGDIWSSLTYSRQAERADDEGLVAHQWRLVSHFAETLHSHRAAYFSPSELVCVDESMSPWYRQGGHWIEHGLLQYVAIDRKAENGCEIQNAVRKKWNYDIASGGGDGRAREDAHIRGRGRSKAWHRHSGPTCETAVREGRPYCTRRLLFCERRGRAAPPGPRCPVHRRGQDRHVQLPHEIVAVQGSADSR
jgi:hypothetical protein